MDDSHLLIALVLPLIVSLVARSQGWKRELDRLYEGITPDERGADERAEKRAQGDTPTLF